MSFQETKINLERMHKSLCELVQAGGVPAPQDLGKILVIYGACILDILDAIEQSRPHQLNS